MSGNMSEAWRRRCGRAEKPFNRLFEAAFCGADSVAVKSK